MSVRLGKLVMVSDMSLHGDCSSSWNETNNSVENAPQEDIVMQEPDQAPTHREEHGRKYDPEAVFTLDLNSDSDDD